MIHQELNLSRQRTVAAILAWCDDGWACRSAFRLRYEPERSYDHIGFRVAAVRS